MSAPGKRPSPPSPAGSSVATASPGPSPNRWLTLAKPPPSYDGKRQKFQQGFEMFIGQSCYPRDHELAGQPCPDAWYACYDPTPKYNIKQEKCRPGQDPFRAQDAVIQTAGSAALAQKFGIAQRARPMLARPLARTHRPLARAGWTPQFGTIGHKVLTVEQYNNAAQLARNTPMVGALLHVKPAPEGLVNLPKPVLTTKKVDFALIVDGATFPLRHFLPEAGFKWEGSGSSRYTMPLPPGDTQEEERAMQDLQELCQTWGWKLNPGEDGS